MILLEEITGKISFQQFSSNNTCHLQIEIFTTVRLGIYYDKFDCPRRTRVPFLPIRYAGLSQLLVNGLTTTKTEFVQRIRYVLNDKYFKSST